MVCGIAGQLAWLCPGSQGLCGIPVTHLKTVSNRPQRDVRTMSLAPTLIWTLEWVGAGSGFSCELDVGMVWSQLCLARGDTRATQPPARGAGLPPLLPACLPKLMSWGNHVLPLKQLLPTV